jgi:hypothetical protein
MYKSGSIVLRYELLQLSSQKIVRISELLTVHIQLEIISNLYLIIYFPGTKI